MQAQGFCLTSAATGTQQHVVCIARPTKSLSVAMETQNCVPSAMSCHEIIHTAVNIHIHIRYLIFLSNFNQNQWFLSRFLFKSPVSNFMNTCGQMDRHDEVSGHYQLRTRTRLIFEIPSRNAKRNAETVWRLRGLTERQLQYVYSSRDETAEEIPGSIVKETCDQQTHALLTKFHILKHAR